MTDERPWMSMDVPDFVREAEEAMARGETLGGSYTEILDGLTPEDLVAFPYGKNVKPGAPAVEGDMSDLYG